MPGFPAGDLGACRPGFRRGTHGADFIRLITLLYLTLAVRPVPLVAQDSVRFAVIGDFGEGWRTQTGDVADLIKSWGVDFMLTVGDNNYPNGAASTIDDNIGQYYSDFIYPYSGAYGPGDTVNRFFPALGNHDWNTAGAVPYLDYFQLPGNERYYDIVRGPVHFFIVDSDNDEPDGNDSESVQAGWLESALASSTAPWNIVLLHHAPWSSCSHHGSQAQLQWPYEAWGADAVIAGHDHVYERLKVGGITYFVDGLGGSPFYDFGPPIPGSVVRFTGDYGAMLADADTGRITFRFITRTDSLIDSYTMYRGDVETAEIGVGAGWNLISLPLTPVDPTAASVFPTALTAAFSFDSTGYQDADTLSRGRGYWVKFGEARTIEVWGATATPDTVPLIPGWNLVGGMTVPVAAADVTTVPADIVVSKYYSYENGYSEADTLVPGKGYWVKIGAAGVMVPD